MFPASLPCASTAQAGPKRREKVPKCSRAEQDFHRECCRRGPAMPENGKLKEEDTAGNFTAQELARAGVKNNK